MPAIKLVETAAHKPAPMLDDIFFHKTQIKIGTRLRYMGRLAPNTTWVVTSIRTRDSKTGRLRPSDSVQKLSDDVYLRREDNRRDLRQGTFQYLSYSAIWRLAR